MPSGGKGEDFIGLQFGNFLKHKARFFRVCFEITCYLVKFKTKNVPNILRPLWQDSDPNQNCARK